MPVCGLQKSTWKLYTILSNEKVSFLDAMFNKQTQFLHFSNKGNIAVELKVWDTFWNREYFSMLLLQISLYLS